MFKCKTNWINKSNVNINDIIYVYNENDDIYSQQRNHQNFVTLSSPTTQNLSQQNGCSHDGPQGTYASLVEDISAQDLTNLADYCKLTIIVDKKNMCIESIDVICSAQYVEVFSGDILSARAEYIGTASGQYIENKDVGYSDENEVGSGNNLKFFILQYSFDDPALTNSLQFKKLQDNNKLTIHSIYITICKSISKSLWNPVDSNFSNIPNSLISIFSQMLLTNSSITNRMTDNSMEKVDNDKNERIVSVQDDVFLTNGNFCNTFTNNLVNDSDISQTSSKNNYSVKTEIKNEHFSSSETCTMPQDGNIVSNKYDGANFLNNNHNFFTIDSSKTTAALSNADSNNFYFISKNDDQSCALETQNAPCRCNLGDSKVDGAKILEAIKLELICMENRILSRIESMVLDSERRIINKLTSFTH